MRRIIVTFLLLFVTVGFSFAQEVESDPALWKTTLEASLGLTQAAYSDNWQGGEVGSIIWAANLHGTAEKQLSSLFKWENDLKLAFGQTHNQDKETKDWAAPEKSTDKIRFDSILKFTFQSWVDPYVAGIFESQFYDASNPDKKFYINPMELTESAGASKTFYDDETGKAATRIGFGFRQKIARYYDSVNDETTSESTYDGGVEWVTDWTKVLSETLNYTTKLSLFQAFFYSEADVEGIGDDWKATDVFWENILTARVAKIVQVSLAWELRYDKQISPAGQFKETLALGLAWVM
jgi:hypothetical protein